jgi:hypothetical protein
MSGGAVRASKFGDGASIRSMGRKLGAIARRRIQIVERPAKPDEGVNGG